MNAQNGKEQKADENMRNQMDPHTDRRNEAARRARARARKRKIKSLMIIIIIEAVLICALCWLLFKPDNKPTPPGTEPSESISDSVSESESGSEPETPDEPADTEPPVITGTKDITITIGDSVSYRAGVTVTDNEDENPILTIDNSKVDLAKAGKYEVTYTATDASGNTASATITLTVKEKSTETGADPTDLEQAVEQKAQKILSSIKKDGMNDMEVAFAIYRWCTRNIGYVNDSDKSNWLKAADQAFTKRSGDCFNYFAAAKALLDAAGIENMDIVKSDTSHSRHYWSLINLGDGWYHFDTTPRKGSGDLFFMVTDEELLTYSKAHNNSHIFDLTKYPKRATESVQDKVDYANGKIKK